MILLSMWLFWIAMFCEQEYNLSLNRHLGDLILTGMFLFFGLFMYVSWPIALTQLIYGAYLLWKQRNDIGKKIIFGSITTIIAYIIIIFFFSQGVVVEFGP